jgi:hypothetical protein
MIWILTIIVVGLVIYVANLKQKVVAIESQRTGAASFRYTINALDAVMAHPKFTRFVKIRDAASGKLFKDWSKEDKAKWHKVAKPIIDSSWLAIRYLPAEDIYSVTPSDGKVGLVDKDDGLIYSTVVLGDKDGYEERLELRYYSRLKGGVSYLTVALAYCKEMLGEDDFTVLCDMPVIPAVNDDVLNELGFKVKRSGGDDFYEDDFGDNQTSPAWIDIEKNNVKFGIVY